MEDATRRRKLPKRGKRNAEPWPLNLFLDPMHVTGPFSDFAYLRAQGRTCRAKAGMPVAASEAGGRRGVQWVHWVTWYGN